MIGCGSAGYPHCALGSEGARSAGDPNNRAPRAPEPRASVGLTGADRPLCPSRPETAAGASCQSGWALCRPRRRAGQAEPRPAVTCAARAYGAKWVWRVLIAQTEGTARKAYRTRDQARADVFDYIERSYNARRRHSTLGYLSPVEFEKWAALA
jgi:hypothetical protein